MSNNRLAAIAAALFVIGASKVDAIETTIVEGVGVGGTRGIAAANANQQAYWRCAHMNGANLYYREIDANQVEFPDTAYSVGGPGWVVTVESACLTF